MLTCSPREGHQLQTLTLDQITSPLPLVSIESMQDGLGSLVVFSIPETSTMVQNKYQISRCLLQSVTQSFSKKGMIAIPLTLAIERHHKQIGMLKPVQHLLAVSLLGESITERSSEALEDTGGEQKGLHLLWLLPKHHLGQIVQDITPVPTGLL